jgi:hypothetical protein
MIESVASELWGELKRYVNTVDRAEAADTVLSILIDNDCDMDDIKEAFKGDTDIKRALASYIDNNEEVDDEDDDSDYDEDENEDWEN